MKILVWNLRCGWETETERKCANFPRSDGKKEPCLGCRSVRSPCMLPVPLQELNMYCLVIYYEADVFLTNLNLLLFHCRYVFIILACLIHIFSPKNFKKIYLAGNIKAKGVVSCAMRRSNLIIVLGVWSQEVGEIFFTMFTDKNFLGFSKSEWNEKMPRNNCTSWVEWFPIDCLRPWSSSDIPHVLSPLTFKMGIINTVFHRWEKHSRDIQ